MSKRILDSSGGVVSVIEHDDLTDETTISDWQDFTPYFDQNRVEMNSGESPYIMGGMLRKIASIPPVLLMKWLREDGIKPRDYFQKPKAYSKWLRLKYYDSDNSKVLTDHHAR